MECEYLSYFEPIVYTAATECLLLLVALSLLLLLGFGVASFCRQQLRP